MIPDLKKITTGFMDAVSYLNAGEGQKNILGTGQLLPSLLNLMNIISLPELNLLMKMPDIVKHPLLRDNILLKLLQFRDNFKNFTGRYQFQTKDRKFLMSAVFDNGRITVAMKSIDRPHIKVVFKDDKALRNFIFAPKPDILGAVLTQDVVLEGNLNYIYKFAYMAKRLQLIVTGKI